MYPINYYTVYVCPYTPKHKCDMCMDSEVCVVPDSIKSKPKSVKLAEQLKIF